MDLEVGGSIPPTNFSHISSVGRGLTFNQVVMGSSPICDNLGMKFDGLNAPV